ncbi:MAG: hypothetical protein Q4E69_02510 [Bacilli bacterium]|nr:hypothetical protein [Bacilli bacterium]
MKKNFIKILLIVIIFVAFSLIGVAIYSSIITKDTPKEPVNEKEYRLNEKHTKDGVSIDNVKIEETTVEGVELGDSKGYKVSFTVTNDDKEPIEYGQVVLTFLYENDEDGSIERTFNFYRLKAGDSVNMEKTIILDKTNFYDYKLEVVKSDDAFDIGY